MKRAEHSTPLRTKDTPTPAKPPENPAARKPQDAREQHGDAQQERNRRDMGVAEDHRTEAMKKGRRGTFP